TVIVLVAVTAIELLTGPARADGDDVVYLKNGGRMRGSVMVEDPQRGVRIKLIDGTVKTVPPSDVDHVDYAQSASAPRAAPPAHAPPEQPAPAPAQPSPAPPPAAAPPPSSPAAVGAAPSVEGEGHPGSFSSKRPPVHAFAEVAIGYGHVSGSNSNTGYSVDGHAVAPSTSIGMGLPVGRFLAIGLGGTFCPLANPDVGFGPAGFFGAYLSSYPIPN